jgi:phospholipid/cholesterol/gamma-HCH transport system permease protein
VAKKLTHFRSIGAIGAYLRLTTQAFWYAVRRPPPWRLFQAQLFEVGVGSLFVVALTGLATGLILATQSFYQLADKGLAGATGLMVTMAMITELGPVLTAVMVTGRVGAAMCAELGSMSVTEQIDALRSMAVDPIQHLITPRLVAGTVMVPILTAFSILTGMFGGFAISVYYFGLDPVTYWDPIPTHVQNFDIILGMVKSVFFGILIISICCYKGLTTTGGAAGVGRSTTSSVVVSYTCLLFSNWVITLLMNNIWGMFGE